MDLNCPITELEDKFIALEDGEQKKQNNGSSKPWYSGLAIGQGGRKEDKDIQ